MRKILVLVAAIAALAFGSAQAGTGLDLHLVTETDTTITLGWTPPAGIAGYEFTVDGVRVSNTWDATRNTAKFWKLTGTHTYGVVPVSENPGGTYTYPPVTVNGGPGVGYSGPWRDTSYSVPATFTKVITTAAAFKSLVSAGGNLQPGDVVHVVGPLKIDGCLGCHTLILRHLAAPASIYIDQNVVFAGDTNTKVGYASVYLDASNINLYGGQIAGGTANSGLNVGPVLSSDTQPTSDVRWWGLKIHDVGGGGVLAGGAKNSSGTWLGVNRADIDVETWNVGTNPSIDPHTVKGTGIHAIYVGSSPSDPPGTAMVNNSKFSVYSHDTSKCVGDAQVGQSVQNSEFWIRVANLTFINSAGYWTAARAFTPWTGSANAYSDANITVHDVEAHNVTGPVVFTGSLGSGPVTVEYGRGVNVFQAAGTASYFNNNPFQPNNHISYQNVG